MPKSPAQPSLFVATVRPTREVRVGGMALKEINGWEAVNEREKLMEICKT
jgi:hypothetical protein